MLKHNFQKLQHDCHRNQEWTYSKILFNSLIIERISKMIKLVQRKAGETDFIVSQRKAEMDLPV